MILRGISDDSLTQLEVLHDVALDFPEGYDEQRDDMADLAWQEVLEALGYRRVPGSKLEYLPYSVAFDVEEVWE
jgi:hypothetical protein